MADRTTVTYEDLTSYAPLRGRTRATRTQAPGAGARSDLWSATWAASGILIGVLTPVTN